MDQSVHKITITLDEVFADAECSVEWKGIINECGTIHGTEIVKIVAPWNPPIKDDVR